MTQSFNRSEPKPARQQLRGTMPPAEVILWSKLEGRGMLGCKFRRQFGIDSYTIDFYTSELRLAVELDGESHYVPGGKTRDNRRDATIRSYGIRILRFLNSDVYENLDGVWEAIARAARERMQELGPDVRRGRRTERAKRAHGRADPTPPTPPF